MKTKCPFLSRRTFVRTSTTAVLGSATFGLSHGLQLSGNRTTTGNAGPHVVSIVRIRNGKTDMAIEEAIDLLGGIESLTEGKNRIMLKPNLVSDSPVYTTKPVVIRTLAGLMKKAGKEVMIGEGSAAAGGFNAIGSEVYRTRNREILDNMQGKIFEDLGYQELSKSLRIPLINLHSGDIAEVPVENGYMFDSVKIHRSLTDIDLLCSVPMMKTHTLATVTLAMKNLIGLYPGTEYYSVRSWLHDRAAEAGSPGVAYEILDMVRANKTGLSVIDASTAMEGDGPTDGQVVDMNLIIAGTSPLATDIVGTRVMGFDPAEIPSIALAWQAGMSPFGLDEIEIRGMNIHDAIHPLVRPNVYRWQDISALWGANEI